MNEFHDGRPSHARLIGASIGANPAKTLAEIYRELLLDNGDLSLSGTGFGVVTAPTEGAIVNHSLNDLKPHQLKLLEDLSQHPTGDFSTPLASWLLGADAADDLRQLANAQLIRAVGEGRWHLGESFSGRKPDSNTEALGRILHWYLASAQVCDELVRGKNRLRLFSIETWSPWLYRPQTSAEASAWLLAEHRAIVKLQQRAYDVQLYRYVWGLEESAGWVVYQTCPLTDRWQETSPLAIAAAVEDGNRAAESRMCAQSVHLFIQLGDLDAASVQASKAAELAHEADHSRLAASAIEFQGVVYKERGDYQSAIENFRKALAINEKLGLARGAALQHRLIGESLVAQGEYDQGREELDLALEFFAAGDQPQLHAAHVLAALTLISAFEGEVSVVEARLPDVVAAFDAVGSIGHVPGVYEDCGDAFGAKGFAKQAKNLWSIALEQLEATHNGGSAAAQRLTKKLHEIQDPQ